MGQPDPGMILGCLSDKDMISNCDASCDSDRALLHMMGMHQTYELITLIYLFLYIYICMYIYIYNVNLSLKIPGIPCPKHEPCSAVLSLPAVAKAPQPALLCLRKDHGKMRRCEARQHVPKGTSQLPANQESLTFVLC